MKAFKIIATRVGSDGQAESIGGGRAGYRLRNFKQVSFKSILIFYIDTGYAKYTT
jgi:hypothetical protein